MITPEQIIQKFSDRERQRASLDGDHARVRRIMDGDPSVFWEITAGIEENPTPRSNQIYVANMMLAAGEALSRRIAAAPIIGDAPTNPDRKRSVTRAQLGEKVKQFWWKQNTMKLTSRQIAKWLLAYGQCPIVIRPDLKLGVPCFEERDPLTAYPAETSTWRPNPSDIVFRYKRLLGDLRARYQGAWGIEAPDSVEVTVLEFYDKDESVMICHAGDKGFAELERIPNRAGEPMFVVPKLITFGTRQGAFNQLTGLLAAQARLTILMMMAAERQVFPDTFISGAIVGDAIHTGPDAVTLLAENAKVQRMSYNSGFQFLQEIDRLERSLRVGASFPSQFSGETPSTLATGRGNQTLIGATVDEGVRERQEILSEAYRQMFEKGVALIQSGQLGNPQVARKITVQERGSEDVLSFIPAKMSRGTTKVEYGLLSAADASQATVMVGQLVGAKLLSEDGGREKHPFVDDPALEKERVMLQDLDKALMGSLEQQVAAGQVDARTLSRIKRNIKDGDDLEDALEKAMAQAQEAQQLAGPAVAPPGGAPAPGPGGPPDIQSIMSRLTNTGQAQAMMQQITPVGR